MAQQTSSPLKYTDETDRSYGLTGMTISMVVWDGADLLAGVSLDNEPGNGLEVTPDFDFAGNPRLSARLAWNQLLKHLELSAAMIMGNAMCRAYVGQRRTPTSAVNAALRALVRDEGREVCSLDDDEIDRIYAKTSNYLTQIYNHPGVVQLAHSFADTLRKRRRLSAAEALDCLAALQNM